MSHAFLVGGPTAAVCLAASLAAAFVGSLYVWPNRERYGRTHYVTVRRRTISVCAVTLLSLALMRALARPECGAACWLPALGFVVGPPAVLAAALLLPLALTAACFLGPLVAAYADEALPGQARADRCDYLLARVVLVAPVAEEIVFRSCSVALLRAGGMGDTAAVLVSPLFFGLAHMHALIEGEDLAPLVFQCAYTTVFGWYSAYQLVCTGTIWAPILSHAFCNFMGFPDLGGIVRRPPLLGALLVGVAVFAAGFNRVLDPSLYR